MGTTDVEAAVTPCTGCHWFDACAQINADCEARFAAARGRAWTDSQRQPLYAYAKGTTVPSMEPYSEEALTQAMVRAKGNYAQIMADRAARRELEPEPEPEAETEF